MDVYFILSLFFFVYMCVRMPASPRSIAGVPWVPGASGLPYYCAPLVCVPAVLVGLAVWRHNTGNKTNTKKHLRLVWGLRKSRDASQPFNLVSVNLSLHVECLRAVLYLW